MVGLLMVLALATLLYFLWDDNRARSAEERQLRTNAERGGALFALNCRACHGLTGLGPQEAPGANLPGAPLNTEDNRNADQARINYLRDTIRCGRVGTVMPAWSQEQGGSLNDFQIFQLITLITSEASEEGWRHAIEEANHSDEFQPPKHLVEAVDADDETFRLNDATGLTIGNMLRIDEEPTDEVYEIVTIVDSPAGALLTETVDENATELPLTEPALFEPGDTIRIEDEILTVMAAPARAVLAEDIDESVTEIPVDDAEGFEAGEIVRVDGERMEVRQVRGDTLVVERAAEDTEATPHAAGAYVTEAGDTITVERAQQGTRAAEHKVDVAVNEVGDEIIVERGAFGTDPAEHPEGTEVFNGPILPSTTITGSGEGFPPCGQAPAQAPSEGGEAETVTIEGDTEVTMGDNFFEVQGARNPTLQLAAGQSVTLTLKNTGRSPHNMRIAGEDGEYMTDDDTVSTPEVISGGAEGTIELAIQTAGTYPYRCDFHPTDMAGEISVQ